MTERTTEDIVTPNESPTPTAAETKQGLWESTIDAYYDEYKEYANYWRNLETKAQGSITVAGIFIAGAFALITKAGAPSETERAFLLFAVGFLLASVIFSILALKIRRIPAPPLGSFMDHSVSRLVELGDAEFNKRLGRLKVEHVNKWRSVMKRTTEAIKLKAERLWVGQLLLIMAVLTVAVLVSVKTAFLLP